MSFQDWSITPTSSKVWLSTVEFRSMTKQGAWDVELTSSLGRVEEFLTIWREATLISAKSRLLFSMKLTRCLSKASKRKSTKFWVSAESSAVEICRFVFSHQPSQDGSVTWPQLTWSQVSELLTLLWTWRIRRPGLWNILQSSAHSRTGFLLLLTSWLSTAKDQARLSYSRKQRLTRIHWFCPIR